MDYNAFSAGVEPGGLRNTKDIGILICYILDYINRPFQQDDLIDIIQENGFANYFEATSALSELVKCGNVKYADGQTKMLEITKDGKLVSRQLNSELSISIRQKAVTAVLKLTEKRKIEQENPVTVTKAEGGGYNVNIRITDGARDLMGLTLFVPDRSDANTVKRHFHENPERIYSIILASVIGEKEMIKEALKELQNG